MGIEDGGALQGEPLLCAAYCTSPEKARAALAPHFLVLIVENVKPVLSLKIDVVENKNQPVLVIRSSREAENHTRTKAMRCGFAKVQAIMPNRKAERLLRPNLIDRNT